MEKSKTASELFRQFSAYEQERLRGILEERSQAVEDLQNVADATAILLERAKQAALEAKLDLTKIQRLQAILDENPEAVVDVTLEHGSATRKVGGGSDPGQVTAALTELRHKTTTDA